MTSARSASAKGTLVEVDPSAIPRTEPPTGDAPVRSGRVRGRRRGRGRQAGGIGGAPGCRKPNGTLVNGLLHRFGALADVGDPIRPGIVHRLDAGSSGLLASRSLPTAQPDAYRAVRVEHGGSPLRRRDVGVILVRRTASSTAADWARSGRSAADGGGRRRQGGPHGVRGHRALRDTRRAGSAVVPAADRAHAPDPGPPCSNRPPARPGDTTWRAPVDARAVTTLPARRRAVLRPPDDRRAVAVHTSPLPTTRQSFLAGLQ